MNLMLSTELKQTLDAKAAEAGLTSFAFIRKLIREA